jgi:hypothetical protein
MRKCLFCDNKADSHEHAWPDWILESIKTNKQMGVRGFIIDRPISWKGIKPELRPRCVCKTCNHGWMNDLEKANKPLLSAFIRDIAAPIGRSEQEMVARWVVKTAMVFEFIASKRQYPFYSKEERTQLRLSGSIPIDTTVWLARNAGDLDIACVGMDAWYNKPEIPDNLHIYVTTILVKYFAIQVMSAHLTGNSHGPVTVAPGVPAPWDKLLIQAWPIRDNILWPPELTFNDNGPIAIGDLVRRWGPAGSPLPFERM